VAVWDLEDLSIMGNAQPDLSEFLTARVQETVRNNGVVVVEREKLLSVLGELSLGSSELADESARLRIGRIAGAKRMIFGGYQIIGQSMRIDLRMVETETGRVLRAVEKTVEDGGMTGRLSAAEEAARNLTSP
jgi:curli biogenesis system outer membrane secretion channel CsgG